MEGGAARCQKCAQMQDELTRNLREKAGDKQEIRKLDKLVSDLTAKLAKAEGKAQQALLGVRQGFQDRRTREEP